MIKRLIFSNFWTKVSSLFLATLIWFYVSGEENIEVTKEIPVTIKLSDNFVMTNISADIVKITLKGSRETIKNTDFQNIIVSKDLTAISDPGNISFQLTDKEINVPKFTTLANVTPAEITVSADKLIEKELTVEPVLQNRPSLGYAIEKVTSNPAIAKVKGPHSIIKKMSKIYTMPIDLTGRNKSFSQKTQLEPILPKLSFNQPIDVSVRIKEESEQKTFEKAPIGVLKSTEQRFEIKMDPDSADLVITGPMEIVSKIEVKDIKCYIDIENLKEGDYELPVQTKIPKDVSILKISPMNIKISIKEESIPVQTVIEKRKDIKKEGL